MNTNTNTVANATIHECGLSAQSVQKQPWQMTRRAYIDSLIAAGELFGVNGLLTKLAKTTAKGVRTEGGKFVPYDRLSHVYEHKCRVEEAIRKGWPVPAEVLADYPDLAQQAQSSAMQADEGARSAQQPQPQERPSDELKRGDRLPPDFVYHNTRSEFLDAISREGMTSGSFSRRPIDFGGDTYLAVRRSDIRGSVQEHDYGGQWAFEPVWEEPIEGFEQTPPIPPDRIYVVNRRGRVIRRLSES